MLKIKGSKLMRRQRHEPLRTSSKDALSYHFYYYHHRHHPHIHKLFACPHSLLIWKLDYQNAKMALDDIIFLLDINYQAR